MEETRLAFTGFANPIRATFTISRGITPSVCLLTVLPEDRKTFSPGTLTMKAGKAVEFKDMLPIMPHLRTVRSGNSFVWVIPVLDHRWRWRGGSISGEFNRRLTDGTVDSSSLRTPQQLAAMCLSAMGESGYDVSAMPAGVYPYVNWNGANPAKALAWLCNYVACEITGGEVGKVVIVRNGQGSDLPSGGNPVHAPYRVTLPTRPTRLVFRGGPTVFGTRFPLQAIAQETNGSHKLVERVSYEPDTWSTELPFTMPTVEGAGQAHALESVWRWYRATRTTVYGCPVPIASLSQCLPLFPYRMNSAADLDGVQRKLPAYILGNWWDYVDDADNTGSETRFLGEWRLREDQGIVVFEHPVFKLSTSATVEEAELYLYCAHHVRDTNNSPVIYTASRQMGGTDGDFPIVRPEVFYAVRANWVNNRFRGTTTSLAAANSEASQYLSIFADSFANVLYDDREWAGVEPLGLSGKVHQVRYQVGTNVAPTTRASTGGEFDVYRTSSTERKRREAVL